MAQALSKVITFDEFIIWYPCNSRIRYELHNGGIVEMTLPSQRRITPVAGGGKKAKTF
jgi:Uma2 family endonuclease